MPLENALTVDFHGQQILTIKDGDTIRVAMKPICEGIGLDWRAQRQRILRDQVMSEGVVIMTTPSKGGDQETMTLPLDMLNGWLFGVDVKRVKPAIREKLIAYKRECFTALRDYWMAKRFEAHPSSEVFPRLEDWHSKAISAAINKRLQDRLGGKNETHAYRAGRSYCYAKLQRRFGVISTHNLAASDFDKAMEFIEVMALEGDWLPASKRTPPAQTPEPVSPVAGWKYLCTFAENGQPNFVPVAMDAVVVSSGELKGLVDGVLAGLAKSAAHLKSFDQQHSMSVLPSSDKAGEVDYVEVARRALRRH